jgi:16S rRNA (cytidine1402-2'-O)-methyltransferase
MAGVLYIVATPIGNLEDITLRALRVLKEVDLIAAEDTRHTRHLLDHYGIKTALTSYHEHNERARAQNLVERLLRGDSIALVSDAGTPAISDPGYRLVVAALLAGIQVTPIPGAAALAAVISASGLPSDRFVFEGFLSAKKQEKKKKLQKLQSEVRTLIFYEAPHRLKESLQDLLQVFGDRQIVVAREVTKVHEEFLRGTINAVSEQIANREVKGEITIVVQGAPSVAAVSDGEIEAEIRRLAGAGMGVKAISELLGERYDLSKRGVYRLALDLIQTKQKE